MKACAIAVLMVLAIALGGCEAGPTTSASSLRTEPAPAIAPSSEPTAPTSVASPVDALKPDPSYKSLQPTPYSWADRRMIAHGMGGLAGKRVTNSLEAFQANYKRGYRVFEVDLALSSDGALVARHDWQAYMYEFLGQKVDNPYKVLSESEFRALKIHGRYTPLTVTDLIKIMKAYPDTWFITDTKSRQPAEIDAAMAKIVEAIGPDAQLADRLIIQVYDEPMFRQIRAKYPFKNIVYTLYQLQGTKEGAIKFAADNGIRVVAIPESMWSPGFVSAAQRLGLKTALYTTNDPKAAARYRASGVSLIYSDFLPAK